MKELDDYLKNIERSIIKKYRKSLWTPFVSAITEFSLVEEGDKIAVCISGGKDSFLQAKLLQEIQKHGTKKFDLEFIAMNPGFNEENLLALKENSKKLGIDLKVFDSDVFSVAQKIASDNPCYICARMRRGFLYSKAKDLGCNKISLGHHYDDVIETTMLNLLYAGNIKAMLPKLRSQNFEGLQLIRPLYYIREEAIVKFAMSTELEFMNCGCMVSACRIGGKRLEIKRMLYKMRDINEDFDKSIMRAMFNVNVDSVLGYQLDGKKHSFLDEY